MITRNGKSAGLDDVEDGDTAKITTKKVDGKDLVAWKFFQTLSDGQSSWYDFNLDGKTDAADRAIIKQHLGMNCLKQQ